MKIGREGYENEEKKGRGIRKRIERRTRGRRIRKVTTNRERRVEGTERMSDICREIKMNMRTEKCRKERYCSKFKMKGKRKF